MDGSPPDRKTGELCEVSLLQSSPARHGKRGVAVDGPVRLLLGVTFVYFRRAPPRYATVNISFHNGTSSEQAASASVIVHFAFPLFALLARKFKAARTTPFNTLDLFCFSLTFRVGLVKWHRCDISHT